MIPNTIVQDKSDLIQYTLDLPDEDIRRLIMLFQLTDDWVSDVKEGNLTENYALSLRSQFSRLVAYYYKKDKRDKAQLASTLHASTFFAENEGLTVAQIEVVQMILTYFQRVELPQDELRECTLKLYRSGIEVTPPMPLSDFEEFLALSGT